MFDRGWADAYERAGGRYYPKLQASVPFTPATGPRLLIRGGVPTADAHRHRAGGRTGGRCARPPRRHPRSCDIRARRPSGSFSRTHGFLAAHRPAVPLAQPRFYAAFDDFPRLAEFAASQGDQARAARCGRCNGITIHASERQRHHRRRLGRLLRVLHGDRFAQMGPAVSHPKILLADRREHEPTTCCW